MPDLPPGFEIETALPSAPLAPGGAATAAPPQTYTNLPNGWVVDTLPQRSPPASTANLPEWQKPFENIVTGLQSGVGNLLGTPHALGELVRRGGEAVGFPSVAGAGQSLEQATPSASDINDWLYRANARLGLPAATPYQAETPFGQIEQTALGAALPAA